MEGLSLDASGDFLLMAATLTNIKSRLLLPKLDDEDSEPAEDPRLELTRPLKEYARFKEAAYILNGLPLLHRDVFTRGEQEDQPAVSFDDSVQSTIYQLIEAWSVLAGRKGKGEKPSLKFTIETKTIGQKLAEIRNFLLAAKSAHFQDLARQSENSLELALSFLAILELARTGFLRLYQDTEADFSGPGLWLADPEAKNLETGDLDYR
jgi:segregation and condensation protein A